MDTTPTNIPRRDFLQRSAAGLGVGLVLGAPSILRAAETPPSKKLNVALVGMGKQGQVLFEAMRNIPGLHFQAVCDIWDWNRQYGAGQVRALQKHTPKAYVDIDEMLATEKDLDVAIIATPDFWHSPHTVKCLGAGLNVYCEKMMSNTIDGARAMVRAMESSGKLCQIGHQRRSNPRYRFTHDQLINGNKICGQIINANGQWNRSLSGSQDIAYKKKLAIKPEILEKFGFVGPDGKGDMHRFMNWRFYRALSGGAISDLGAHQIDIFNWFLGAVPKSVFATGGHSYFKQREHFDNIMALLDYDTPQGEVRAFYQVLTTTSAGGGFYETFMGTEGSITISEVSSSTAIYREGGDTVPSWSHLLERGVLKPKPAPPKPASSSGAVMSYASPPPEGFMLPGDLTKLPHQPHLENFFAAVRGEAKLNCDARHAFESEAPIFWINPSADSKQPIVFTPEQLSV
jgi:predicted dehydrogenase